MVQEKTTLFIPVKMIKKKTAVAEAVFHLAQATIIQESINEVQLSEMRLPAMNLQYICLPLRLHNLLFTLSCDFCDTTATLFYSNT